MINPSFLSGDYQDIQDTRTTTSRRSSDFYSMNIKFSYLYRDAANYKQHNEVVFANPNKMALHEIETKILCRLIDGFWFVVKDWNLPDLHFKEYPWNEETDHQWHEFDKIEETDQAPTTPISIRDFLKRIKV